MMTKLLFFLKTYSDSTLNTKYESITRKTERDSLKIDLKFHHLSLFPTVGPVTSHNENKANHEISDLFLKLSRSVFRVRPSYLVFRELSEYVFRENKSFYHKIFFRVTESILDQMLVILVEISALEYHRF